MGNFLLCIGLSWLTNFLQADMLSIIANKWRHIRREALTVLRNKKYVEQKEGIRDTGKWEIYKLYDKGKRINGNCENRGGVGGPAKTQNSGKYKDACWCENQWKSWESKRGAAKIKKISNKNMTVYCLIYR